MDVRSKKTGDIIRLNKSHFITSGGEGHIYARNGIAYKISIDPRTTIPYNKIQELSLIQNPNVIKPEDLLTNKRGIPVGYSMKHISNTYVLCQLFPKAFRLREKLENNTVLDLILQLRKMIEDIHKAEILVVDLNELNFLVSKDFKNIYGIDVNSFQTKSFPATALMESVRDRHSKTFSELTDWFSFGIVSFQLFVGIHPFKGRYPKIRYPQDKMRELNERMLKNIPVFHSDVRYPGNVLPFDVIPQAYKDWYKSIFVNGQRVEPPIDAVEIVFIPTIIKETIGDKDFDISKLFQYDSELIDYISVNGIRIAVTKNKDVYINGKKSHNTDCKHFGITPKNNKIIGIKIENNKVMAYDIVQNKKLGCSISAQEIFSYKGRVYVKNMDDIIEIEFAEMKKMDPRPVPRLVGKVMENATYIGYGVVIQNVLGRYVASMFPKSRSNSQVPIEELDGYKVVEAKYDSGILIIIASKKGRYDKFILKFDDNNKRYSLRKIDNITYSGINFTVLENGVVIHINETEEIELFHKEKDSSTVKVLSSSIISGDMRLYSDGVKVLFSRDKEIYRLKMK